MDCCCCCCSYVQNQCLSDGCRTCQKPGLSLLFFCGSTAGPASVQYQPAAATLYQAPSGSPPSTGLPRVSLAANQQAASVRSPLPLAPGVPQQQQVVRCLSAWCLQALFFQWWSNVGSACGCRSLFRSRRWSWEPDPPDRPASCQPWGVTGS